MKRVLISHYFLTSTIAGGEFLPLSLVAEFQKRGWDVTLVLERQSVSVEKVSQKFDIPLNASDLKIVTILPKNRFLKKIDSVIPCFRVHKLKKLAKNFDLCISASNACDFGRPAHHFISSTYLGDSCFCRFALHEKTNFSQHVSHFLMNSVLRPLLGFRSFGKIISDPREHIYPNSHYLNQLLLDFYGPFSGTIFYPPTLFRIHLKDIRRDPLSVVYIGRIVIRKRIPDIISIVERARALSGMDLKLRIAGLIDSNRYADEIKKKCQGKEWIQFVGALYGEEKEFFLLSGTYAVHAERDEAFGISVVEYLQAGCIPVIPDEGGTPEIVDNPSITFHTNEQAAQILTRLLKDEEFRKEQLNHCRKRAEAFSFERYMEAQHNLVDKILEESV